MFSRQNWVHTVDDITTLRAGDHIYRRMKFLDNDDRWYSSIVKSIKSSFFGFHHGIIYWAPSKTPNLSKDEMLDETVVFEQCPSYGMHLVSLRKFQAIPSFDIKKVKYGVSTKYLNTHLAGTCQTVTPDESDIIIHRIDYLLSCFQGKDFYNVLHRNCEQIALFCTVGNVADELPHQIKYLLLGFCYDKGIKYATKEVLKTGIKQVTRKLSNDFVIKHHKEIFKPMVKQVQHALHTNHIATDKTVKIVAKTTAKTVAKFGAKAAAQAAATATDVTDTAVATTTGVGTALSCSIFGGAIIGIELITQLWRISKYCRRNKNISCVKYTKYDLKKDSVKGWTNAIVMGGAGVGLLAIGTLGWWILPILFGVSIGLAGMWYLINKKFGKTEKQKWYMEYEIKENNKESLISGRRKLRRIIRDDNLHPDRWSKDLPNVDDIGNQINEFETESSDSVLGWITRKWKEYEDNKKIKKCKNECQLKMERYMLLCKIIEWIDQDLSVINGQHNNNNDDDDADDNQILINGMRCIEI